MLNNSQYGGFFVSKNVLNGVPIGYTFREESDLSPLNGWTIFSSQDDDDYVNDPRNFEIVSGQTMFSIAPVMEEIFETPYGTDLVWIYEEGVHIGFHDLTAGKEVTIEEILGI